MTPKTSFRSNRTTSPSAPGAGAWSGVRRLLVVRLDNIGDVVMLGPSLRSIRRALPQATITLLASPAGAKVAPLLPWIDDAIVHSASWQQLGSNAAKDPAPDLDLVRELRRRRFDAAIIFTSFSQSPYPFAYVCYLAGIPIRLGQSKEFGGAILTQEVKPPPDHVHQVDRNLFLLQAAGFPGGNRRLELAIPPETHAAADALLQRALNSAAERRHSLSSRPAAVRRPSSAVAGAFILFAPAASCSARRYPLQRAATVARRLPQLTGLPVVVVGSEKERKLLAPIICPNFKGVISLVGRTSVPQLAALIHRAALVITNNSGPMHIADALRRPMVVLYSGTDQVSQWRPGTARTTLLMRTVECSPCYRFNCPYNMECLDIPPRQVLEEVMRLLGVRQETGNDQDVGAWLPRQELTHEQTNRAD